MSQESNESQVKLRNIPGISRKQWNGFQNFQKSSEMSYNSPIFTQQYIEQVIHENSPYSEAIFKLPQFNSDKSSQGKVDASNSSKDTQGFDQNGSNSDEVDNDQDRGATQIEEMNFIYEHFRIILRDFVDFFIWISKIIDIDQEKYSKMKFELNGEEISFFRAGVTPTELVSVADYMMYTWNDAVRSVTKIEHRMSIDDKIIKSLKDHCRRLYRLLAYAYFVHDKDFEIFEKKHHLALKFTLFVRSFKLMKSKDLWMPKNKLKKLKE